MSGRVLLTGGTGLVGTDIFNRLIQERFEVVGLGRRRPSAVDSPLVTWIEADLSSDPAQVLKSLPSVNHVVHAAAARIGPPDRGDYLRRVNMEFTDALFDWAGNRRVQSIVYVSGFNILQRPLARVIDEDHPLAPLTRYAVTKYWGEIGMAESAIRHGTRGVSLRVSSPVAFTLEQMHDTVVKSWILRAKAGQPLTVFGQGERTQDFVATTDIAECDRGAIRSPTASGIYNVASGTALSMRQLAELIARRWNSSVVLGGVDPLAKDSWNISIDKARRDLGFAPQYSARAAIEKLLASIP